MYYFCADRCLSQNVLQKFQEKRKTVNYYFSKKEVFHVRHQTLIYIASKHWKFQKQDKLLNSELLKTPPNKSTPSSSLKLNKLEISTRHLIQRSKYLEFSPRKDYPYLIQLT